jgi:predicted phosphate transport protein (TIGR00153 family)
MKFGRRKDVNYFAILSAMADCSRKAAAQLDDMLNNYTNVAAKAEAVHDVEHEADDLLHGLTHELNRAFVTPIDREDLLHIGNGIDSITDAIEDVANSFDTFSIKEVENEALAMSKLIVMACKAMAEAVKEFEMFRSSKKLSELIIEVNRLEEKGDMLYRSTLKALYNSNRLSVLDIVKWKDIYDNMERILDTCEDVANLIEGTVLKNR